MDATRCHDLYRSNAETMKQKKKDGCHPWQERKSEASEREAREQAERDWERMEEEVRLGAEL